MTDPSATGTLFDEVEIDDPPAAAPPSGGGRVRGGRGRGGGGAEPPGGTGGSGGGPGGGEERARPLTEELETSFLEYSMSVIVDRALPDVRDGLKPVHRRILWSMHQSGFRPDRPFVKSARVVGDVMARYHPHGDTSIYDALVRMGQPFSLLHPLIEAHGNFGSPSDPPAAMRYTECRLSEVALAVLDSIDEETVDLAPTFDGTSDEPVVLPSRIPNLLVNGAQGIAVGMATNVPPHNLVEVAAAAKLLVARPDATVDDVMALLPGPDFPTGALVMGREGLVDAYRTGRGSIRVRATTEVEETRRGTAIVVTELPYQVSVDAVADKIAELVEAGTLDGVRDIRNESARGRTRLVVELRGGATPEIVRNNLFKHTPLQTTFGINLVALVDGVPRTLDVVTCLRHWLDHQEEVVTRRSRYRLDKAESQLHIVEGLLKALDRIDEIIALIRGSRDRAAAKRGLQAEPFEFTEIQATHILDLALGRLTQLGKKDLADEAKRLRATIKELRRILGDRGVLLEVVVAELDAAVEAHGQERRTVLVDDVGDLAVVALVQEEPIVVTVTARGYVRAVPARSRGAKVAAPGDRDAVAKVVETTTLGSLLVFTDRGKAYRLRGADVPRDRLTAMPNLFQFAPDERVVAVLDDAALERWAHVLSVMASGQVKKSETAEFAEVGARRDGVVAAKLGDGDEVVAVLPCGDGDEVVLATRAGAAIRFAADEARPLGRAAAGVRGMRVRPGDPVVAACVLVGAAPDDALLVATSTAYAKRVRVGDVPAQARGGSGVRLAKLNVNQGSIRAVLPVGRSGDVLVVADDGAGIRAAVTEAPWKPRDSGGGRWTGVPDGTAVAGVLPIPVEPAPDPA
jgi:DNA gyrase subunit A